MRNWSHEPTSAAGAGGDPLGGDALRQSDPERLGALFRELQPRLRAVAVRYTRDPDAAQDVMQTAFEKAIRHRDQFRGGSLPSTWMHRIVANEALMWLRSEKRRARRITPTEDLDHLLVEDETPTVSDEMERRQEVARVREAIACLSPDERLVTERCALEGRSYRQFSDEFGVHPAAAKSRAFRARRRLGQLLATRDRRNPGQRESGDAIHAESSPRTRQLG